MSKSTLKWGNLYDKDGNLLKKCNEKGILENYTMEELEALVDKLGNDKDENGNLKNPQAFNNAQGILFQYYQKYGNPHEKELLERVKELNEKRKKEADRQAKIVEDAKELTEDNKPSYNVNTNDDEYVEFKEAEEVLPDAG